ncbi:hypothetical protein, partial [Campylobacter jejuni]|uniref:hypothetical protein n=1 Tax=Campylobacter jejuni TaxID=197 RepID=UPI001E6164A5
KTERERQRRWGEEEDDHINIMAVSCHMMSVFLALAILQGCLLGASYGHRYHFVGGSFGWQIPPNTTFYHQWAAKRTFFVGDKLVFRYRSDVENVLEVSAEDFPICGDSNIIEMYETGPTIVELKSSGRHFFFSGVGLHCEYGQKFAVHVRRMRTFDADEYLYSLGDSEIAPAPSAQEASG